MAIFKLLTYVAGALTVGLLGYLTKILDDSGYLEQIAQLPKDDVMIYHIVAAVVIVWLIFSIIMKVLSRAVLIVLLVLAVGAEGMFLGLNLSGIVEIEPESLQEQIKEQFQDKATELLDDLKDKIND